MCIYICLVLWKILWPIDEFQIDPVRGEVENRTNHALINTENFVIKPGSAQIDVNLKLAKYALSTVPLNLLFILYCLSFL